MLRRDFLRYLFKGLSLLTLGEGLKKIIWPISVNAALPPNRWLFLVDTYKCLGCGFCVQACKLENEIPVQANVSRTWVERYVVTPEGTLTDSPKEGREGFINNRVELAPGRYQNIPKEKIKKGFFVPKLCNQCEKPPCVQVCPVGATYKTGEGITLIDRKWCIGCGYCIMACPYGMRFFHPQYHVADKCNFCYHRIHKGIKPACVLACPTGARNIGNLRDPEDQVKKIIISQRVGILKGEYGTKPQVYYLGLSEEVR